MSIAAKPLFLLRLRLRDWLLQLEIFRRQFLAVAIQNRTLYCMIELSDISRPGMHAEQLDHVVTGFEANLTAVLMVDLLNELGHQERNIIQMFPKWRGDARVARQPIVKNFAKLLFLPLSRKIGVGGRKHSRINRGVFCGPLLSDLVGVQRNWKP